MLVVEVEGGHWGGEGGRDGVRRGIGMEGTDRFEGEAVVLVFLRGPCAITVGGLGSDVLVGVMQILNGGLEARTDLLNADGYSRLLRFSFVLNCEVRLWKMRWEGNSKVLTATMPKPDSEQYCSGSNRDTSVHG